MLPLSLSLPIPSLRAPPPPEPRSHGDVGGEFAVVTPPGPGSEQTTRAKEGEIVGGQHPLPLPRPIIPSTRTIRDVVFIIGPFSLSGFLAPPPVSHHPSHSSRNIPNA